MATPTTLPATFTAGQVLTAAQMNNLRGAFRVLQVVSASYSTGTTSSSSTFVDTGLTATITPSSTTSKILVIAVQEGVSKNTGNAANCVDIQLLRGSTVIQATATGVGYTNTDSVLIVGSTTAITLDSPATTSATTYKTQFRNNFNGASVTIQRSGEASVIILAEISA